MKADVLSTDRDGDIDMLSSAPIDPEWVPPVIDSVNDFELCRTVRERGRPTGQYETLSPDDIVKETLVNWECLFIQFKDESGEWRVFLRIEIYLHYAVNSDVHDLFHRKRSDMSTLSATSETCITTTGGLLPIKVSLPALVEDDDEEPDHSVQKGKRKAAPTDGSES